MKLYTGTEIEIDSYDIVAKARGQEVIWWEKFGGYQGEWVLIAKDKKNFYIYKDWYGSCSGCDSFEAEFGYSSAYSINDKVVQGFIEKYKPFLTMPTTKLKRFVINGNSLMELLPANSRQDYENITWQRVVDKFTEAITAIIEGSK